ncbi:MAG TPA: hypothetical protein VGF99_10380 [Myxococcota bacterium]
MLLTIAMILATQAAPAVSMHDAVVPLPIQTGALGAAIGGATLGGGMLAFSAYCVQTSASCPWGDDGGEIIGAIMMVPATMAVGVVGGAIVGAVVGYQLDVGDERHAIAAREAREQRLLALRAELDELSAQLPGEPPPSPPPVPQQIEPITDPARIPDDVDVDGD